MNDEDDEENDEDSDDNDSEGGDQANEDEDEGEDDYGYASAWPTTSRLFMVCTLEKDIWNAVNLLLAQEHAPATRT